MNDLDTKLDGILAKTPCVACDGGGAYQTNEDGDFEQCQFCGQLRQPFINEAKQAIKQLLVEAKIEELEHIISGSGYSNDDFDWYEKTPEEYTGTKYYSEVRHLSKADRIAELKGDDK